MQICENGDVMHVYYTYSLYKYKVHRQLLA